MIVADRQNGRPCVFQDRAGEVRAVRRIHLTWVLILLCGLVAGCGGSRDKGKNQDYDRPKATAK